MAYDFKKEFKELYRPSGKPSVLIVPSMSCVASRSKGDPNAKNRDSPSHQVDLAKRVPPCGPTFGV